MTPTALLFFATSMLCIAGLLASLVKPVWFRFNGSTPRRWTIGTVWFLLAVFCAINAASQMSLGPSSAAPSATSSTSDMLSDITTEAVPADPAAPPLDIAVPMDAARPAQDWAADVVPAPPTEAPSPVPPSRRFR